METQAMGDTGTEEHAVEAHDAAAPRSTAAAASSADDTEKDIAYAVGTAAAAANTKRVWPRWVAVVAGAA
jgi:hypothetical protein